MDGYSSILDQNKVIKKLSELLTDIKSTYIILEGISGTGKTYIAEQVENNWLNYDVENDIIELKGDIINSERALFPFTNGLSTTKNKLDKNKLITKSISEFAKGIPIAGDFVSYFINTVANFKDQQTKHAIQYLNSEEQNIIYEFSRIYRSKNLLIIADNLHWWDEPSLRLLDLIVSGKVEHLFPVFKSIKIIGIITTDQDVVSRTFLDNLLNKNNFLNYKIIPISQSNYSKALEHFGFSGTFSENALNILYSLTRGHLELIKKIANYLTSNFETSNFSIEHFLNNLDQNKENLIEELLTINLKSLGKMKKQIIELLEYASVIGLSFDYKELACISKEHEEVLKNIINKAKQLSLLVDNSFRNSFSHELIRDFFFERLKERKTSYYKVFAKCLEVIRPSDYYSRAKYLFEAKEIEEAAVIYIIGYLRDLREGINTPKVVINRIEDLIEHWNLKSFWINIKNAYSSYYTSEFDKAKEYLIKIEDIYDKKLLAEKYYLLALVQTKTLNYSDLVDAKNHLMGWDDLKNTENEIWCRIMLSLLIVYIHLYDNEYAKKIEREIVLALVDKVKYDSSAQVQINILRRKASSLYINEIACERTSKSIEFFSLSDTSNILIRPIQYYMAVTNHSGNLLVSGDFEKSFIFAKEAIDTLNTYGNLLFPRPLIPSNNYIISGILSKTFSLSDALYMFNSIFDINDMTTGQILLRNNLGVLYALNGDIKNAQIVFENIITFLNNNSRVDGYYHFFPGVNLATIKFLKGEKNTAKEMVKDLNNKIPDIPDKLFLRKRCELLTEIMSNEKVNSIETWNETFEKKNVFELGKAWKFYGSSFLFSDIQFWSES